MVQQNIQGCAVAAAIQKNGKQKKNGTAYSGMPAWPGRRVAGYKEVGEADHADQGGGHEERTVLEEGPPRAWGESLSPGATSRHRPF